MLTTIFVRQQHTNSRCSQPPCTLDHLNSPLIAAECGTPEHTIIAVIAAFVIVLHALAIPSCFLVLLVYSQRSGHASPQLSQALAFLHGPFEAHSCAWEFVEMVKSEEDHCTQTIAHPQA